MSQVNILVIIDILPAIGMGLFVTACIGNAGFPFNALKQFLSLNVKILHVMALIGNRSGVT